MILSFRPLVAAIEIIDEYMKRNAKHKYSFIGEPALIYPLQTNTLNPNRVDANTYLKISTNFEARWLFILNVCVKSFADFYFTLPFFKGYSPKVRNNREKASELIQY